MTRRSAHHAHEPDPLKGLAAGLIGGLVGTIAMTLAQNGMQQATAMAKRRSRQQEQQQRPGVENQQGGGEAGDGQEKSEPATTKLATTISEHVFHHEMSESEKQWAGSAVHYGFGTCVGAVYGVLAEYMPQITRAEGAPFGTTVMAAADEITVPALGLSAPPTEQPAGTHAYSFAAHLVYGVVTELTRDTVRRWLR